MKVYLIFVEPSWGDFILAQIYHIFAVLLESFIRPSRIYYYLSSIILDSLCFNHLSQKNLIRKIFEDKSSYNIWKERFALNIMLRFIVCVFSSICGILLFFVEFLAYTEVEDPKYTPKQCLKGATYSAISLIADTIIFAVLWFVYYKQEPHGRVILPFTRLYENLKEKSSDRDDPDDDDDCRSCNLSNQQIIFAGIIVITFILAGITHGGKHI